MEELFHNGQCLMVSTFNSDSQGQILTVSNREIRSPLLLQLSHTEIRRLCFCPRHHHGNDTRHHGSQYQGLVEEEKGKRHMANAVDDVHCSA